VLVSGRSLGEVQEAVQKALGTQYRDTSADVSVSRLRTVRVYVVGEVEVARSLRYQLAFHGAERACGRRGATRVGSLRSLKQHARATGT